jgi:SPP1 gp7 family putative phage head morphogenesis protein
VGTGDAFNLEPGTLAFNAKEFQFLTDDKKLEAFNAWFKGQVDSKILSVDSLTGTPWTSEYVQSAYRKGVVRAYTMVNKEALAASKPFYDGGKAQFLKDAFNSPEAVSKVRLLGTRTFETLKGITSDMGSQLNQILAGGIAEGRNPKELARQINAKIDGISRKRALTLARTEVIHAHAEGQLDSFKRLGVDEIGIEAEWLTAGDKRVCPRCAANEGKVFSIDEARGLIPLHPNCRCAFAPVVE